MSQFFLLFAAILQAGLPVITAPSEGQVIQGQVQVTGSLDPVNFSHAELSFGYAGDTTATWFLIAPIGEPIQDGSLGVWDTGNITDGDYRLRLRQYFMDGSYRDVFVEDLQLLNTPATATPVPSPTLAAEPAFTPASVMTEVLPTLAALPTAALSRPTPKPLPANPAAITSESVFSIFGRGALLALILFIVLGVFLALRRR